MHGIETVTVSFFCISATIGYLTRKNTKRNSTYDYLLLRKTFLTNRFFTIEKYNRPEICHISLFSEPKALFFTTQKSALHIRRRLLRGKKNKDKNVFLHTVKGKLPDSNFTVLQV